MPVIAIVGAGPGLGIRIIRNKVMHFHPDPVPEDAVEKLRRFNSLLHRYRDPA